MLCRENKSAYQLRGYCAADLCFRICKKADFLSMGLICPNSFEPGHCDTVLENSFVERQYSMVLLICQNATKQFGDKC